MNSTKKMLLYMTITIFFMIFTALHEMCFFIFLWVKRGFGEAWQIHINIAKWWNFVHAPTKEFFFFCGLLPFIISVIVTLCLWKKIKGKMQQNDN